MNTDTALRAAAAGASTGGRTFTALAALALATPRQSSTRADQTLHRTWAKVTAVLLAAGELAADKLPQAPSRLAPPGFGGRVVTALGVGAIVADRAALAPGQARTSTPGSVRPPTGDEGRHRRDIATAAGISVTAAVATAWLGQRGRAICASRLGGDRPGALLEDAAVIGLAGIAAGLIT